MPVRVWDYLNEWHAEEPEIMAAVRSVFESGQLVGGPAVREFERSFGAHHGGHECVSVDNGTNAIKLALEALGVGPGDHVLTVSNTAAPTVVAIAETGARPIYVDVEPETFLMDVAQVEQAVTPLTKAVIPVHLYGQCVAMDPLLEIARGKDLSVVEDCAQSHGARHGGRLAGTMGDVAAFSFYPTKVLGAYGDGGAVLTRSNALAEHVRQLKNYGMGGDYYVVRSPGHNCRLDAVQAAILASKLQRLGSYIQGRQDVAGRYVAGLHDLERSHGLRLPRTVPGNDHVYYQYVVRHPHRDDVLQRLRREHDIDLKVSYQWPCHTMTGLAELTSGHVSLPVTDQLSQEIFSLPMYPGLTEGLQDKVIAAVRDVVLAIG